MAMVMRTPSDYLAAAAPAAAPHGVLNAAGGTGTFAVSDTTRLNRFLILGAEGGSYYTGERQLTLDNAAAVARLIGAGHGVAVVQEVVAVSTAGRAAKQQPGLALEAGARTDVVWQARACELQTEMQRLRDQHAETRAELDQLWRHIARLWRRWWWWWRRRQGRRWWWWWW